MKNIILYFLGFIFSFFPKNKKILIFGDRNGLRFTDNSRYLLLFLKNINKEKLRLIWITRDKNLIENLRKKKIESYYYESVRGVYFQLIAYWHIYNYSENDIHPILTKFTNNINLWHGFLIKKITKFKKNINFFKNITFNFYLGFINFFFKRYFFYPNLKYAKNLMSHFPKNFYTFFETSFPRNLFFTKKKRNTFYTKEEKQLIKSLNKKRIVGFFPTWRKDGSGLFVNNENENYLKKLNQLLKKNNCLLIYKPHMNSEKIDNHRNYNKNFEIIEKKLSKLSNFKRVGYNIDLNTILPKCNILISDYSGAIIDYLYLNKPIILFLPDNEKFKKTQGIIFDIEKIKIGHTTKNIIQLNTVLKSYFNSKKAFENKYLRNRINLCKKFNIYNNFEKIIKIIN